jgi:hypothetical protein
LFRAERAAVSRYSTAQARIRRYPAVSAGGGIFTV